MNIGWDHVPDTLASGEAKADRTQVEEHDVDLQVGGDSAAPFVEHGVPRDPEDTGASRQAVAHGSCPRTAQRLGAGDRRDYSPTRSSRSRPATSRLSLWWS
jgi:hypothetical protein